MQANDIIEKKFVSLYEDSTVSELIGKLKKTKASSAVVIDKKDNYKGIVDKKLLLKSKIDPSEMKISKITEKVPKLEGKEDIYNVARLMFTADTKILPIIESKKIKGIVRAEDIIKEFSGDKLRSKAAEIIKPRLITLKETDRVGKAFEIMKEKKLTRLPIVDKKGDLTGILCLKDILYNYTLNLGNTERHGRGSPNKKGIKGERAFREKIDLHAYKVIDLASRPAESCSSSSSVKDIISKMFSSDISSIILEKGKKPVGIITIRDILKLLIKGKTLTF